MDEQQKKPGRKRRIFLKILVVLLVLTGIITAGLYMYTKSLLGHVERQELDHQDLGIQTEQPEKEQGITNILLFGVDSRDMNKTTGRSDAILILTADRTHHTVKLTSLARDSYVAVDGHGKTKLTHAFVYGGPQLAVKTVNQNFDMDIQDFVSVNFGQLASIIDLIGGVTLDVSEAERKVMNNYIAEHNHLGIPTEPVAQAGKQLLTGSQAVAYARNRYTGTDMNRMERQREVLYAMAEAAMDVDIKDYPELLRTVLSQCVTSLTDDEIMSLAMWAGTSKPTLQQYALPDENCAPHGEMIDGVWYSVYNLDKAAEMLHDFIDEEQADE